jgi:hypothetical protein
MAFCCKRCGYQTQYKHHILSHLRRKKPCEATIQDIPPRDLIREIDPSEADKKIACSFCDKAFPDVSNKCRHEKTCKKSEMEQLKKQVQDLQRQFDASKASDPSAAAPSTSNIQINQVNQVNNTQNNNIITINITSFGIEKIPHIENDVDFMTEIFINKDIRGLIRKIHCDPAHPEHHNVRIMSRKQELMETVVNGKWLVADKEETLDNLLSKGRTIITHFSARNKDHLLDECEEEEYAEIRQWLEELDKNDKIRKSLKQRIFILIGNFFENRLS